MSAGHPCAGPILLIGRSDGHGSANGACPAAMESSHTADLVCSLLTRPGLAAARVIFSQIGQARLASGQDWEGVRVAGS